MAKAMFTQASPFFQAEATVLYCKSTVNKKPVAHFVVQSNDGFNTCQAGLRFNLRNYDDSRCLNAIARLLGANKFQEELAGKSLRMIAQHTNRGIRICAVIHPSEDMAVVINGASKIVSVKEAISEIVRNG